MTSCSKDRVRWAKGHMGFAIAMVALLLALPMALTGQQSPPEDGPRPETGVAPESTAPSTQAATAMPYLAITPAERGQWYLRSTGRAAIAGSLLGAGWSTASGTPSEYPATWEGFGKRYALSLSGVAIANGAEVGLGALWGEDPRYFRKGGASGSGFGSRVKHVLLSTVTARNRQGETMPAYARYVAISGSGFLQNAWRPDSQSSAKEALLRTLFGFLGRMSANAIGEFLPDFRKKGSPSAPPAPAQAGPAGDPRP